MQRRNLEVTMDTISADERLIVALDVDTRNEAAAIVEELGDSVSFYKVGLQLFMATGFEVVNDLTKQGKKVFLDLKIDDTPRTVESAVRNMAKDGVEFFTLHGNGDTANAARAGRGLREYPKFLQVPLLSSWDTKDLREHLHITDTAHHVDLDTIVVRRARRILESGCDGVIASGTSVRKLRQKYPDILIVSPGIRPEGSDPNDHKRMLTPYDAIKAGANYLVVGRPIRHSNDPAGTARHIQGEIRRALADKNPGSVQIHKVSMTPA